jgi:hypothetical protein
MIKNYAAIYFHLILLSFATITSSSMVLNAMDVFAEKNIELPSSKNVFQTLEKPIESVLLVHYFCNSISKQFYEWHENYFYYSVNKHHKKMFLSARILTASIPLAIIAVVIYTSPQVATYLWNINYTAIISTPSTITPASVIGEIGKLSSFNQNCIMIGLEKGLRWIMERKIAADVCINPATWFTDQNNHDFINTLTSILLIFLLWIYLLYNVYADATTRWKNLGKIVLLQVIIRYALYLAHLKNDIYTVSFIEQATYKTNNATEQAVLNSFQLPKDLQESIEDIATSLKKLIKITKKNQIEQQKLVHALGANKDTEKYE